MLQLTSRWNNSTLHLISTQLLILPTKPEKYAMLPWTVHRRALWKVSGLWFSDWLKIPLNSWFQVYIAGVSSIIGCVGRTHQPEKQHSNGVHHSSMDSIQIVSVEECLLFKFWILYVPHINRQREFYRRVHIKIDGRRFYVSVSHVGTYARVCCVQLMLRWLCDVIYWCEIRNNLLSLHIGLQGSVLWISFTLKLFL